MGRGTQQTQRIVRLDLTQRESLVRFDGLPILTAILGIVGAFVATFLGQALGWYRPGEGAGLIGAVVGAIIVLLVYGMVAGRRRVV